MAELSSTPKGCKHPAFMTHDWGAGNVNHERVVELAKNLQRCGLPVWIDEQEMTGDIATKMCKGIQDSDTVVVCLTERYMKKVNGDNDKDNCKLEFDYAASHHGKSKLIPVVMEKAVCDTHAWTDSIGMYLNGTVYVKMWDEDDVEIGGDGFRHLVKEIRSRAPSRPFRRVDLLAWIYSGLFAATDALLVLGLFSMLYFLAAFIIERSDWHLLVGVKIGSILLSMRSDVWSAGLLFTALLLMPASTLRAVQQVFADTSTTVEILVYLLLPFVDYILSLRRRSLVSSLTKSEIILAVLIFYLASAVVGWVATMKAVALLMFLRGDLIAYISKVEYYVAKFKLDRKLMKVVLIALVLFDGQMPFLESIYSI
eukprot:m.200876 g.200876  ORF g.200876 m.200876 type:complete len:369 (+) comp17056_c0_seq12:144-1250(+)